MSDRVILSVNHCASSLNSARSNVLRTILQAGIATSTFHLFKILYYFKRGLRRVSRDGSIEAWSQRTIFKLFMRNMDISLLIPTFLLARWHYDFQISELSSEFKWLDCWIGAKASSRTGEQCIRVSVGNKSALVSGDHYYKDSADVQAIKEDLGYKGWPWFKGPHWFWYRGGLFKLHKRDFDKEGRGFISKDDKGDYFIRMYAMSRAPFFHLLAESKRTFEAAYPPTIGISYYNKSTWSAWRTRPKRTLEDIIITPENRLKLKNQVEDFLKSKNWYANRGLSWKKGLLLYGPPGCGKTSTIIGLASNYNLNIHYLSLTQPGMNDESLGNAIRSVQQRSIVCLEDCDVWARRHKRRSSTMRSTTRTDDCCNNDAVNSDTTLVQSPPDSPVNPRDSSSSRSSSGGSHVTLAGLLNVLDGITEVKGVVFILTTNDMSALDPALIRPGRVDACIELRKATQKQAEDLFISFYRAHGDEESLFSTEDLSKWAKTLSNQVKHEEFSIASLQSFLIEYRIDPMSALVDMPNWLKDQRNTTSKWVGGKSSKKKKRIANIVATEETVAYEETLGGDGEGEVEEYRLEVENEGEPLERVDLRLE